MKKVQIPIFSNEEIAKTMERMNPISDKACNNNLLWGNMPNQTFSGEYRGYSFKRSNLNGTTFSGANFDHCNFTGSILRGVKFDINCHLSSVNFLRSILTDCEFSSKEQLHALNFSFSTLNNVKFETTTLRGSYFNSAKIVNCKFLNSKITSTSFDNCIIKNSSFTNCNLRNLNLEFATFINVNLEEVQLPYYQFPYIIGIFKDKSKLNSIQLGGGYNRLISFSEYLDNIQDSIKYFTSKNQFFPLANLYYLIGKLEISKECVIVGIENALINNDYVLIKYFIKLALILEILTYSEINTIMAKIDNHLNQIKDDLNYPFYLMQSYEIQNDLQNLCGKSILNIKIDTIFQNEQFNEASQLCQEIDDILTLSNKDINYNFTLSHNSPIAITLTVVGVVADLITISSLIYQLVKKKIKANKKIEQNVVDLFERQNNLFLSNIDDNITSLKLLLSKSNKSDQGQIIEDFRAKILASIGEIMDINLSLVTTQKTSN